MLEMIAPEVHRRDRGQRRIDTVETRISDESESEGTENGDENVVVPGPPVSYTPYNVVIENIVVPHVHYEN